MAEKKYVVMLTDEERSELKGLTRVGKAAAWKLKRALAMLKCDQGSHGPGWSDQRIAEAFDVTVRSLEHWRKQAVTQGPLSLLVRKRRQRPPVQAKLDGEKQARLTALACSEAPEGHARWTLRLLAEHLVELEVVDSISHETVRTVLKKTT
jgi:transposase